MAFCTNCGQQVAEGVTVCPKCGAAMGAPVAGPMAKEKLDKVPSANSAKMPLFAMIGIAGAVLSFALNFLPSVAQATTSGDITSLLGKVKIYLIISIVAALLGGLGMYYVYDSLKKGLKGHSVPMTGLLATNAILALVLAIVGALVGIVGFSALSSLSLGAAAGAGILAVIALLGGIVYFILGIIIACKLMKYEGEVKTLGLTMLIIAILGVILALVSAAGGVFAIVCSAISCAATIFLYLQAKKVLA